MKGYGGYMEESASRPNVLFVCVHNSARSQMAEGFLRELGADRFNALSAGLEPTGVDPRAVEVMREAGVDISGQRSKGLEEFLGRQTIHYAVFVCSAAEEKCPHVYSLALNRLSWAFEDPASFEGSPAEALERFRVVRDEIRARIVEWLDGRGQGRDAGRSPRGS